MAKAPLSTLMATKQLVSRAWELMGMRMHWKMSTDVMAVVANTSDAQSCAWRWHNAGLHPRQQAARDDADRLLLETFELAEVHARRQLHAALALAHALHHLLHLLELLEQVVDVGGGRRRCPWRCASGASR